MKLTREILGINVNFMIFYVIAIILIFSYDKILEATIKKANDPILTPVVPSGTITGWNITHFVLYFLLGYFYSGIQEMLFFTLIGIAFEIYEETKKEFLKMFDVSNDWWKGNNTDIMSNSLGLILGNYVAYMTGKYIY